MELLPDKEKVNMNTNKKNVREQTNKPFSPLKTMKMVVTLSMSRFSEVTLKRPLCCTTGGFDLSSDSSRLADTYTPFN